MKKTGTTEKFSITIPQDLAEEIRTRISPGEVSSFFAEALRYYLVHVRQKEIFKNGIGAGAWKDEDHHELMTPEDTVRYVRKIRKEYEPQPLVVRDRDAE